MLYSSSGESEKKDLLNHGGKFWLSTLNVTFFSQWNEKPIEKNNFDKKANWDDFLLAEQPQL